MGRDGYGTYHNLSEGASPQDLVDFILLFLVGRRRLGHYLVGDEREHDGADLVAVAVLYLVQIGDCVLHF
jgi:hypothetical protein